MWGPAAAAETTAVTSSAPPEAILNTDSIAGDRRTDVAAPVDPPRSNIARNVRDLRASHQVSVVSDVRISFIP
jgi:hypothetical protein